jgi:hypothetical protein
VAFLELLLAAARARVVAPDVFQGVTHWLVMAVIAMWAVDMIMTVVMVMVMVMVAVRAVNVGLLGHAELLRNKVAGNYLAIA